MISPTDLNSGLISRVLEKRKVLSLLMYENQLSKILWHSSFQASVLGGIWIVLKT